LEWTTQGATSRRKKKSGCLSKTGHFFLGRGGSKRRGGKIWLLPNKVKLASDFVTPGKVAATSGRGKGGEVYWKKGFSRNLIMHYVCQFPAQTHVEKSNHTQVTRTKRGKTSGIKSRWQQRRGSGRRNRKPRQRREIRNKRKVRGNNVLKTRDRCVIIWGGKGGKIKGEGKKGEISINNA